MSLTYYPFELHCHTIHSDGGFTPYELVKAAKENGLKGIALTDHNTASGVREAMEAGKELGIVVIAGIEWTTFYGHITVLGGHSDVDWRSVTKNNVCAKLKEVREAGDIAILAHPYRVGYPVCTGGKSEFPVEIFDNIDGYEVCSSELKDPTNLTSQKEYAALVAEGKRIAAVYGRDWHRKGTKDDFAVTLIGIEGCLNSDNAIKAIKQGHTKIATYSGQVIAATPKWSK